MTNYHIPTMVDIRTLAEMENSLSRAFQYDLSCLGFTYIGRIEGYDYIENRTTYEILRCNDAVNKPDALFTDLYWNFYCYAYAWYTSPAYLSTVKEGE